MTTEFIYHPSMEPGEDTADTATLYFFEDKLLLRDEVLAEAQATPPWTTESIAIAPVLALVLGSLHEEGGGEGNGIPLRLVQLPECPAGWQQTGLRDYLMIAPDDFFKVVNAGAQLRYWLSTQNFCSRCGESLNFNAGDRALSCDACGYRSYPKVSPCVIAVVRDGRRLLLAQNHRFRNNMYSCLAGFIEAGESAEEALTREIAEEAGIRIRNPQYMVSQAWPFPHQLMLGFLCDYDGGELVIDETELRTAGWFDIDELPELSPLQTVARKLINESVRRIAADYDAVDD